MNQQQRLRITKVALYGLLIFIGFALADLTIIYFRDRFIPEQAPPKKSPKQTDFARSDRSQYTVISSRNLFSSQGFIPEPLRSNADDSKKNDTPVPSSLPITLLGTLVHSNPAHSVAAIKFNNKDLSGSFSPGHEVDGLIQIEAVQRGVLFFRNLNNQALEYIEMNTGNNKVSFDNKAKPATTALPTGQEILKTGNNSFKIKRTDLNKYLEDLNGILMQARAIPNRDPNTGEINGFRLVDYQPGSIFDQLGIPRGSVIKGANGEPVTSVQSAMEMLNKLKTSPNVKLNVEVNGSTSDYNYDIQ